MVMGVKSCIFTYFLHDPNNCDKSQTNNNIADTARQLGIDRTTLYRKLKKYNLQH